ncbi:hypothetical protein JF546_08690 [Nitratireductor aquimarinus]|uniref:Uncharacterized protein n=1 Tax=Nitratireductor aquimarinus TaxID=889300 RepID=A0ABU4AL32_9HYPH|nr:MULTISPECIES: hypothetical protein [Alphaproteobacteria]MBY6019979.1 hypothetical protein [Nitratireductor sp. DP7N14-4]MBN7755197.1 hypothetical protein [Nitratireductor aquimarinus]MBN7763018.1 hypothetical protein [Nitratireductor aquibiodomus]MBN7775713.1 hypothetical protein [Nitratireductor pacificus]MBN7781822.1 hypothetical protein [Nitratireductor pacificus]
MRKTIAATGALIVLSMTSGAMAQDAERFRLERTEEGYVRMDTRTGSMSICRERSGQLVCSPAADERTAYEEDITALQDRLDALEERLAALENANPQAASELPSEEEFEQTLGLMERFFRRFMGIVKDFEEEETTTTPNTPAPDRT